MRSLLFSETNYNVSFWIDFIVAISIGISGGLFIAALRKSLDKKFKTALLLLSVSIVVFFTGFFLWWLSLNSK
jgi:hypothetical protein